MFVVLVGGNPSQRQSFLDFAEASGNDSLVFIDKHPAFYEIADLFVYFGGPANIPKKKTMLTWSGLHQETLERIHKTLGLE